MCFKAMFKIAVSDALTVTLCSPCGAVRGQRNLGPGTPVFCPLLGVAPQLLPIVHQ